MSRKFSTRLKELRLEKGLSIQELGRTVKISASTLCRWENGLQDVTSDNLIILSKFFNVSVDYLLGLVD